MKYICHISEDREKMKSILWEECIGHDLIGKVMLGSYDDEDNISEILLGILREFFKFP